MLRKDWPFVPSIQSDPEAITVVCFVNTPKGLSKSAFYSRAIGNGSIEDTLKTAPKLPVGYSYTSPVIY